MGCSAGGQRSPKLNVLRLWPCKAITARPPPSTNILAERTRSLNPSCHFHSLEPSRATSHRRLQPVPDMQATRQPLRARRAEPVGGSAGGGVPAPAEAAVPGGAAAPAPACRICWLEEGAPSTCGCGVSTCSSAIAVHWCHLPVHTPAPLTMPPRRRRRGRRAAQPLPLRGQPAARAPPLPGGLDGFSGGTQGRARGAALRRVPRAILVSGGRQCLQSLGPPRPVAAASPRLLPHHACCPAAAAFRATCC